MKTKKILVILLAVVVLGGAAVYAFVFAPSTATQGDLNKAKSNGNRVNVVAYDAVRQAAFNELRTLSGEIISLGDKWEKTSWLITDYVCVHQGAGALTLARRQEYLAYLNTYRQQSQRLARLLSQGFATYEENRAQYDEAISSIQVSALTLSTYVNMARADCFTPQLSQYAFRELYDDSNSSGLRFYMETFDRLTRVYNQLAGR